MKGNVYTNLCHENLLSDIDNNLGQAQRTSALCNFTEP